MAPIGCAMRLRSHEYAKQKNGFALSAKPFCSRACTAPENRPA